MSFHRLHFFLLAPFYYLRRFIKHDNFLRTMNINNHMHERNVAISLRVSINNHLKLVRIYLTNPVEEGAGVVEVVVRVEVAAKA